MLASFALALALAQPAAAPWEGAPLASDPGAVAAAVAALTPPADAPVDVLLEETRFTLDAQGRTTEAYRLVAAPRTEDGARGWSETGRAFNPWYQDRPVVRARVISARGEARVLDPSSLSEGPVGHEERDHYSDRRVLRAPLPRVEPGAVVEEHSVLTDREPFFASGSTWWSLAMRTVPVRRHRIVVDAPLTLPLRYETLGLGPPAERVEGGRRTLTWDLRDLPPAPRFEPSVPPGEAPLRGVAFSTARDWHAVAAGYSALVERQLQGADLAATARDLVAKGDAPAVAARKILAHVLGRTRYTSLSLGEAALVPARPAETLSRGFGDCKDLSLVVVGLLRAAGYPASLALVRTGGFELLPGLPGMGVFDHAIVRIGGKRPLYVDPTLRGLFPGELPSWLQGRYALEVSDRTAGLEQLPVVPAAANQVTKVRRVELAETGAARVSERTELHGTPSADSRDPSAWEREGWLRASRRRLDAPDGAEVTFDVTPPPEPGIPTVMTMTASASAWGSTRPDDATASVSPAMVFRELGAEFNRDEDDARAPEPEPRRGPFLLGAAFRAELRYEVVPPPGFRPEPLPADGREAVGPGALETRHEVAPDGTVRVTYRYAMERRRLEPAEVDTLRKAVGERSRAKVEVRFRRIAAALLQEGKTREAVAELRRLVALHPKEARHRNHLAVALAKLGLVDAARRTAREAVALEPGEEWGHRVLAFTLQRDPVGRELAAGADLVGAVEAQREARDLAPGAASTRAWLARLLEQSPSGERYGPGARLDEALAERRHVHDVLQDSSGDADLARLLFQLGKLDEAIAIARAAPAGVERDALLAAAATVKEGPAAFRRELLAAQAGAAAAKGAMFVLINARHYGVLAALMREVGGSNPQAQAAADLFARARPAAAVPVDPADPASLPRRLFQAFVASDARAIHELLAGPLRARPAQADEFAIVSRQVAAGFSRGLAQAAQDDVEIGLGPAVDVTIGALSSQVEGSGPWKVTVSMSAGPKTQRLTALYGVKEDGVVRLAEAESVAARDVPALAALGFGAARAADVGAARTWLRWSRSRIPADATASPARDCLSSLAPDLDAAPKDALLAAAACAASGAPGLPRDALDAIEAARAAATGATRDLLTRALAVASVEAADWDRALAAAADLELGPGPDALLGWRTRVQALLRTGRAPEARRLVEARLAAHPDEPTTLALLASVAAEQGDLATAARVRGQAVAKGKPGAAEWNNAAWIGLFVPAAAVEALQRSQRALEAPGGRAPAPLHTRAAVLAAQGQLDEAVKVLQELVGLTQNPGALANVLVLAKIAEGVGLDEDAAEMYRRVQADPDPSPIGISALARSWAGDLARRAAAAPRGR